MLEIILLFVLGKKISEICKSKGRSGWPYVLMFIGLWFFFELAGAVVGVILAPTDAGGEPNFLIVWICGIVGAAGGAVLSFVIVNALPPTEGLEQHRDAPPPYRSGAPQNFSGGLEEQPPRR
jgi:hypothetical protein